MLIYLDMLTNEELFSDSYPMELIDDLYWKVTGKVVTESTQVDESVYGGNASAEGGGEDFEANVKRDVNIILAHSLKEIVGLDRKTYL
ncbi:hypothetical protein, partial [Salmonella sp. s55962]|uniref:hypothetical protein n=1 Tax=Salmonella sp. s55962 TaxID=3159685 RepID=UPI0039815923